MQSRRLSVAGIDMNAARKLKIASSNHKVDYNKTIKYGRGDAIRFIVKQYEFETWSVYRQEVKNWFHQTNGGSGGCKTLGFYNE